MSYDLFFYKQKGSLLDSSKFDIEDKQLGEVVSWDKVFNAKP